MEINLNGLRLIDNSDQVREASKEQILRGLEAIGLRCVGSAKLQLENYPRRIDTGLLRNSITYALSGESVSASYYHGDNPSRYSGAQSVPIGYYTGKAPEAEDKQHNAVYVGTNVEYAAYVHEGTRSMLPNRFITNAVQGDQVVFKNIMRDALEGNL